MLRFFSQVSDIIVSALNQNLVEFELKPGVRVIVYNTQLTLGKKHLLSLLSVLPVINRNINLQGQFNYALAFFIFHFEVPKNTTIISVLTTRNFLWSTN